MQDKLHEEWKGFAPPGTCTLVDLPQDWTSRDREPTARSKNVWGTQWLALCPTMRVPSNVTWDREVVYECIWSLLNAIYKHNRAAETSGTKMITSMCMSPLATGSGFVSEERWASQMCLAIRHFHAATDGEAGKDEGERRVTWGEARGNAREVEVTWKKA